MKDEKIDLIISILKKNEVKKAALFGSTARGEETAGSDIDLLIEFQGEKSLLDLVGLQMELQEQLRKKVDLVTYQSLHPLLRDRILAEQKVLF